MPKYKKVVRQGRAKVAKMNEARQAKRKGKISYDETSTTYQNSQQNCVDGGFQDNQSDAQPHLMDISNIQPMEISNNKKKIELVDAPNVINEKLIMRHNVSTDRIESSMQLRSRPYSSYAPTMREMDLHESSSSEPVDIKSFIHNPWLALNATPSPALDPKPSSIQNEDSSSSFTADENSSYFQFFGAIHSEFLELSPKNQGQFKKKCLDYLYELVVEENNSHQSHGYSYQNNVLNLSNSGHMSEEEKDVKPVVEDGYILSST